MHLTLNMTLFKRLALSIDQNVFKFSETNFYDNESEPKPFCKKNDMQIPIVNECINDC